MCLENAALNAKLTRPCLQTGLTLEIACRQALARSCALSSASRCRTARVSGFPARPHGFRTSPFTGPDRILAADNAQRLPILEAWPEFRRRSHGRNTANAAEEESGGRCDELVLVTASSVVATASLPNQTAAPLQRVIVSSSQSNASTQLPTPFKLRDSSTIPGGDLALNQEKAAENRSFRRFLGTDRSSEHR